MKERLEGAARQSNAAAEAAKAKKTQKKAASSAPKQPTIQLKMDFSNFG